MNQIWEKLNVFVTSNKAGISDLQRNHNLALKPEKRPRETLAKKRALQCKLQDQFVTL